MSSVSINVSSMSRTLYTVSTIVSRMPRTLYTLSTIVSRMSTIVSRMSTIAGRAVVWWCQHGWRGPGTAALCAQVDTGAAAAESESGGREERSPATAGQSSGVVTTGHWALVVRRPGPVIVTVMMTVTVTVTVKVSLATPTHSEC